MLPLVLSAMSAFVSSVPAAPQMPSTPAREPTSPPPVRENVLDGLVEKERLVTPTAAPLPRFAPGTTSYRLRLGATRIDGRGPLLLAIPTSKGEAKHFVSKDPERGATIDFEIQVDRELATAVRDAWLLAADGAEKKLPAADTVVAWSPAGTWRLDSLKWQPLETLPSGAKTTSPSRANGKPAVTPNADPLARLGDQPRWRGRLTGEGKEQDCTVVVLHRTQDALTFRLENERGGWFRFECSVKEGRATIARIVHTRAAGRGATAIVDQEKGTARVVGGMLVVEYSFRSAHRGKTETITGKVRVPLD